MVVDVNLVKTPIKPKAYKTMLNMRKDALIEYIRTLEHNYNVSVSFNQQQAENFLAMNPGWISIEERLPDDSFLEKEIIICVLNRFGERNVYTKKFWGVNSALWNNDITHWMPLPEPPTEEEV